MFQRIIIIFVISMFEVSLEAVALKNGSIQQNLQNSNHSSPTSLSCRKYEIACHSGKCISQYSICDAAIDCDDGSDETVEMCSKWLCPSDTYQCKYGGCVSGSAKCNGTIECPDGSDESKCRKKSTEQSEKHCGKNFTCDDGQCIDPTLVCDGRPDCRDHSDETRELCRDFQCEFLFKCDYGACVGLDARCNGIYECADLSDENNCSSISSQQKCILPEKPENGYYMINDNFMTEPGKTVGINTILVFYCNEGYVRLGDETIICFSENNWKFREYPKCLKTCSSTFDFSLQLDCTLNNQKVNCSEPAIENTTITAKCKEYYFFKITQQRYLEGYGKARCINGTWNPKIDRISCTAECGYKIEKTDVEPLIIGGQNVTDNRKYPWHVALFRKWKAILGITKWSNECGGSIIRSNVVLTAAHCFVHSQAPDDYAVGAGKIHKRWNATDDPDAQYRYVGDVIIIDTYEGDARSYAHDIAVVVLTEHFIFNKFVLPICIDWTSKIVLTNQTIGTTAGWGLTATGNQSEILKEVHLPYVSYEDCRRNLKGDIRLYHTDDKICAGRLDGQAVCKGDSGGAFAVQNKDDNLYYIIGIVSLSKLKKNILKATICDTQIYTLFTNVSYHSKWLEETLIDIF